MSDNWVVQNLENALETWNSKLSEIWQLLTTSPQQFKGGSIWSVMVNINGAVQAIGLALLVLFFVVGVVRTCGSFTDVKKPEHALKLFIRFAVFKTVVYTDSPDSFKYYQFVNADTAEDFTAYVEKCKKLSLYETGITAEYGDKLLTLSTCEYSRTNGRLVVVAKLINE